MKIGRWTNGISCEYLMQTKMREWLKERELEYIDEFYVPEISRRPDFLIIKGGQLINIEAKCNNHDEMIRQLKDNANYCNYSFAYIPDYCMTSMDFKRIHQSSGFGLFVFNYKHEIITEVLEAHHNAVCDKALKKTVIDRIRKELIMRKKKLNIDTQQPLDFSHPSESTLG
jgi:competence CoiA-like predicted nuclease